MATTLLLRPAAASSSCVAPSTATTSSGSSTSQVSAHCRFRWPLQLGSIALRSQSHGLNWRTPQQGWLGCDLVAMAGQEVGEVARAEPVSTPEALTAILFSSSSVESLLDTLKWDKNGLVVAIAQNVDTGVVLMQGFANRDAVSATMASRRATFFSRSRSSLWTKGETSSNFIHVLDIYLDCDRDSIVYLGKPDGPTCHTGAETCYYTSVPQINEPKQLASTLYALEDLITQRKSEEASPGAKPSWTRRLLQDPKLLCSKIREEASELCQTLESSEGRERTVSEMADVLYHSMVLLSVQDVKLEEVMATLRKRFGQSGVEEKSKRAPKPTVN